MKNTQQYWMAFLLICIFSIKVVAPLFADLHFIEKSATEQQEEKSSEERTVEKSITNEFESTDFIKVQHTIYSPAGKAGVYTAVKPLFLPVQYFAIPTPPPWFKS